MLWFQKMVKMSFLLDLFLVEGTQDGKTYDDVTDFMRNTVYPAYENVEGIFASAACKISEDQDEALVLIFGQVTMLLMLHQM
jgi:hypothetical protein